MKNHYFFQLFTSPGNTLEEGEFGDLVNKNLLINNDHNKKYIFTFNKLMMVNFNPGMASASLASRWVSDAI